jgi:hypothetical protein
LAAALAATEAAPAQLRLIGQQVLPARMQVAGSTLGGLSGIDYDAKQQRYVLISDDRSQADTPDPLRLYFATLDFDGESFHGVRFTGMLPLREADGAAYPKLPAPKAPDPEGVRIDPVSGHFVWVSEGDRASRLEPWVRESDADGRTVRDYLLPAMFQQQAQRGPRVNAAFEGLSFTPDGQQLAVIMEAPLTQDGEAPTPERASASRLTLFDRASGRALRQFVYPIDRVQRAPKPADAFSINGPTEILALSSTRFWVLERSFSVGVVGNQVRLYEVDVEGATDVLNMPLAGARTLRKRLVLDFETLKERLGGVANLEGLCFGPLLPNGHRSLVVVADDNFAPAGSLTDRNQILVFEVLPSPSK